MNGANRQARLWGGVAAGAAAWWAGGPLGGWGLSGGSLFNWHPLLMTAAFALLAVEGALAFRRPASGSARDRDARKRRHVVLHSAALALALGGLVAVLRFHRQIGAPDWYSAHSWLGGLALLLYASQYAAGLAVFWWPGGSAAARQRLMPWHRVVGPASLAAAFAALLTGVQDKQRLLPSDDVYDRAHVVGNVLVVALLAAALAALGALGAGAPAPSAAASEPRHVSAGLLAAEFEDDFYE